MELLELKNRISEKKNSLDGTDSRVNTEEERSASLNTQATDTIQTEAHKHQRT